MRSVDPFRDMQALQREIDRAFATALSGGEGAAPTAFLPGRSARAYPLLNVSDDKQAMYVQALAPGLDPQTLEITLHYNSLTIAGEKSAPQGVKAETYHRSERAAGKFVRTVDLPAEVDSSRIEAKYHDGLLTITLPKHEAAKPRQITVAVE